MELQRYKVRLVVKGYNQIEGLYFFDTFQLVKKLTTIKILLATGAIHTWFVHRLKLNNAFLHEELQEYVYMTIIEGYLMPFLTKSANS